jgi:hypothetical protein
MSVVKVNDRRWQTMREGAELERWPDGERVPEKGERITVFDRNLDFTQHDVLSRNERTRRVVFGPAIPYR